MPKVRWGISAKTIDETFDRDKQFKPYDGPVPVNAVYQFQVKVLKSVAGTRAKLPQLRIGLELVPRSGRKDERKYAGYFIMEFAPISDKTAFRYVPFLDAIGVSVDDFADRTNTDTDGNVKSIGKWRNDGKTMVAVQIKDGQDEKGNPRKEVGWIGAPSDVDDDEEESDDEEEYDEEEYDDEEGEEEYDDEEEPF